MRHMNGQEDKQRFDWNSRRLIRSVKLECDGDEKGRQSYENRCDVFCYCHLPLEHRRQVELLPDMDTTGNKL